ncbi:serine hydrolase domain-containing protein [Pseudoduganella aquatica]|uniref:serine hydrolase domain-containing protein n=1 Tax=Pseudoduganella aquatica TaxID=2660641 RepID=UPI001E56048B|nr:serine hydrolase domain-containing protein [Pseudoduganella aquatica]
MKKCGVLFLLAARLAAADAADAADAVSQTPAAFAGNLFAKWNGAATPGCALAISRPDQPVLKLAYGQADLEHGTPNTPDTVFEAGSVSKQFTAAAVLLLAQDGKLALSDDVRKYLPELPDYGKPITLDHLLTHTSGLRDWGSIVEMEGWPRGTRSVSMEQALTVIARQRGLNFPPGERYSYSNSGYVLAAFVVQRVSGKTLAEFTRERIFQPLGMTRTQWRDNFRRVVPGRAIAYSTAGKGYEQDMPFEDVYGHGGLLTTVGDLLIWNEALTANALGKGISALLERRPVLPEGRISNYGHGLISQSYLGAAEVSHDGATAGYRTWLGRYPERRLSIALLCNAGDVNPGKLARAVAQELLAPSAAAPAALAAPVVPAAVPVAASGAVAPAAASSGLGVYAGTFYNELTANPVILALRDGVLVLPNGTPLRPLQEGTFAVNAGTFAFSGPDRFVANPGGGEVMSFRRVAAVAPSSAALSAYTGRYGSDEALASYDIAPDGDKLAFRLSGKPESVLRLKPLAPDVFGADGVVVRFERDGGGRITGAVASTNRLYGMHFKKAGQP